MSYVNLKFCAVCLISASTILSGFFANMAALGEQFSPPREILIKNGIGGTKVSGIRRPFMIDIFPLVKNRTIEGLVVRWPFDRDSSVSVGYPDLVKGDVIPLFGTRYVVSRVHDKGMRLVWIKTANSPAGIEEQKRFLAVPLQTKKSKRDTVFMREVDKQGKVIWSVRFRLQSIAPPKKTMKDRIAYIRRNGVYMPVRKGDVVKAGRKEFKVREIVPRNYKERTIGWIVLEILPEKYRTCKLRICLGRIPSFAKVCSNR